MKDDVQLMTICRNADGKFRIISDVSGPVLYRENEINFLKEALKFLEDESAKSRERDKKFRSSFEYD